jgi:hypothetical protein
MAGAGQYRAPRARRHINVESAYPPRRGTQLTRLFTGFHPHLPSLMHRGLAKTLGAGMWFFIFYRAR